MTSPEETKQTNSPQTSHETEIDPTSNRPMSASDIREAYADYADRMQLFEWLDRAFVGRYRRARFGDVEGDVLDVACGTGTNFPYLPETVDLVGIDVSPAMLANARERLAKVELDGTLQEMDAQELEFADDRFDAVISALSTCTFPDPIAALQEMERVCKPGGTIRLVEHGQSDVGPIAAFQEWRADSHYETMGCRWTQEPREIVAEAGLSVQDVNTGFLGMITTFEIKVE
jgi:ubiquinone/menaquinone biosynthesis C-methylase UbiE